MRNKVWSISRARERASGNRKLRLFLSLRASNWQSNKMSPQIQMSLLFIPQHLSTTTIPNLVLIYGIHLTSGKLSEKEVFIVKNGFSQGQFTL